MYVQFAQTKRALLIVVREVESKVIVDNGKTDAVEPTVPAQNAPRVFVISSEEYHGRKLDIKDVDGHLMTKCAKLSSDGLESPQITGFDQ